MMACKPSVPAQPPETVVLATDYAYQLPVDSPSGVVTIRLENRGKVSHEMALGQLHAGVTADSLMRYAAQGRDPGDLAEVVGILIAGPGKQSLGTLSVPLISGRTYMMICQFKDGDSLPSHLAMGMQYGFVAK